MGTAEEDLTEPSALEECCCGPMFHREPKGLSQTSGQIAIGMAQFVYAAVWKPYNLKEPGNTCNFSSSQNVIHLLMNCGLLDAFRSYNNYLYLLYEH